MANSFYECSACMNGDCQNCTQLIGEDGNEFCDCPRCKYTEESNG